MSIPMILDVEQARRETPGCEEVLHFNNAGSSLMPEPVLRATVGHLELEARMGGYEAAAREEEALERVYRATARMLGCGPDEIAVIENATRAWDMAFYSIPFGPGDRILTAQAEYASNFIAFLQVAKRTGASVEVVPSDESGRLSVEALRGMIDERVKLVAMTHVPTNGGLVNPAAEVGKVARETGCLYGCERQGLTGGRQDTALLGLVASGFGVGLVLGSFRNLRRPGVVYLRLEEPKEIIALAVAWRRGDPSPGLANFLLTVREAADSPAD